MTANTSNLMQEWLASTAGPEEGDRDDLAAAFRGPLHPLLLGADSGERSTCLLFKAGGSEPVLVLKLARTAPGRDALSREHKVLRALRAHIPVEAHRFFPLAVGFHESSRFAGQVQEATAGETWFRRLRQPPGMDVEEASRLAQAILERVSSVGDLALPEDGSPSSPDTARADWNSCVDALAIHFSARLSLSEAEKEALDSVKEKIRSIDTFLFQHGDLFPKNILLSKAGSEWRTTVIDWAEAGRHLPPLFDRVLLLSTLWRERTGPLTDEERLVHFRRVFWESTGLGTVAEKAFEGEWHRWNLSSDWRREDVILLALAVYARRIARLYGQGHREYKVLERNVEYTLSRRVGA